MADSPQTFRSHLPALIGSVIGTLVSAVVGSHVGGVLGTRYALIFGSLISGSASWWGERAIRRSNEIARAKLIAARKRGRELSVAETQMIEAVSGQQFDKRNRGIPYRVIAALVVLPLMACVFTVLALDSLGARAVANIVPPARPAPTHSLSPSTDVDPTDTVIPATTHSYRPTRSASPSAVPSITPVIPSTTPTPTPTLSPSPEIIPSSGGANDASPSANWTNSAP